MIATIFLIALEVVLIETYWNVNKDVVDAMQKTREVLIETYWNVN